MVGGAAYCEDCRARARSFSVTMGLKLPDGACFFAKDKGPEGCMNPPPPLNPANVDSWRLFFMSFGCLNRAGMDGTPVGHHMADVRVIAEGLRVPWDESTLTRFLLLQAFWMEGQEKARQKREAAEKRSKTSRG